MAQPVWKSGTAAGSWTIKGVQEATREAVRDAAAQAELLIGDWVDQALSGAARARARPGAAARDPGRCRRHPRGAGRVAGKREGPGRVAGDGQGAGRAAGKPEGAG